MTNDVTTVAIMSGPIVLLGYLCGALTFTFADHDRDNRRLSAVALEVFATAGFLTLVSFVAAELSPGNGFSRIALRSDLVLSVSQSITLWAGLAFVIGHLAPVSRRFRGGSGLLPALTTTLIVAPTLFVGALMGFFAGMAVLGGRPRPSVPGALGFSLLVSWVAWVLEWNAGWGVANGPELSLWTMVICGALFARWLSADVSPS